MKERMKVMLAYDGSRFADAAIDDLARAGLPRDTEVLVTSVADLSATRPAVSEYALLSSATGRIEAILAKEKRSLRETEDLASKAARRLRRRFPEWKIRSEVLRGNPADELLRKAAQWKPDLITGGSEGRSAIGRFFIGSVSKKVAEEADCSVRVVRSAGEASLSERPPRIIVGVDGSPAAEQAIYAVGQRVWPDGTEVRFVAVDDSTSPVGIAALLPQAARMINDYNQSREERVSSMLEWATEELSNINLKTSVLHEKGDPKKVILEEALRWNADSIFVGTRDFKNSFERFRLGSVSTAVVTNAHCPVEIVRPPRAEV